MLNIVLFEPEIPDNTGNIMRTCVATNTHLHLIRPLGFHLDEAHLKRSGANYIRDCKYTIYDNIEEFYEKNRGTIYYLTRYGHKPHSTCNYGDINENIYFMFGKESTGIPPLLMKDHIDYCLRIPTTNNVRALNVSNCVALVLYEALRQQNYPNLLFDEPHKSKHYIEDFKE